MEGTVIFFSSAKGWGFLKQADGQPDLFCHYSAIRMKGYKELKADQKVSYEIEQGQKGLQAVDVFVLEDE